MELVALISPWFLLLLVVVACWLLALKRWKAAAVAVLVVIAGNWYFETLPMTLLCFSDDDICQRLKVLSFNCNLSAKHQNWSEKRAGVIGLIREQNADVVFLTENFIVQEDSLWLEMQEMYPHRARYNNPVGNRLYCKYPILNDTILKEKGLGYGITCCQIDYDGLMIDVFGVHLSSNNYNEQLVYMTPDSVGNGLQARMYLKNILMAGVHRQKEAGRIIEMMDGKEAVRPTVVMGDFNDVCGAPTMRILESAGLCDAWWNGGLGYGATIHKPLPYRIDHIMYNAGLKLRGIHKVDASALSDHDALVAEFDVNMFNDFDAEGEGYAN